ncbi:HAD family hydrolase [Brevibacillus sp. SYSU BS000544]|uniref:HAD family hydrolase n=1 Tax=Brevibacillus sp. SYSU BS000544 TaxID=3416443 RepID=UPI003CE4F7D4
MSQIKGILFDKDGTLLDFHAFFVPVAKQLVTHLLEELGLSDDHSLEEELLKVIGLRENRVDPKGILASGTSKDIYEAFLGLLQGKNVSSERIEKLETWIPHKLYDLTKSSAVEVKPTADLTKLFEQLHHLGIKVGIATADDWESTIYCLESLGINQYFEFIGTSDHYDKKPDPCMLNAFCQKYQFHTTEVAVVGDTVVDLLLARNGSAGLAVGVLSGVSGPNELKDLADILLPSVGEIVRADGRLIWENGIIR